MEHGAWSMEHKQWTLITASPMATFPPPPIAYSTKTTFAITILPTFPCDDSIAWLYPYQQLQQFNYIFILCILNHKHLINLILIFI